MLKSITDSTGKSFSTVVLTGKDNYNVWAYTMREHLTTAGLLQHVVTPATTTEKEGGQLVVSRAQEAKSMLISAMSASVIEQILHCADATSIWAHLEKTFGARNSNFKLELMSELSSLRCSSVREVPAVVNRAFIIKGKLENLNVQIDDTMIISTLIRALPREYYSTFLESWSMLDSEQQTLDRFETKLLEKTRTIEEQDIALVAISAQKQPGRPSDQQNATTRPPTSGPRGPPYLQQRMFNPQTMPNQGGRFNLSAPNGTSGRSPFCQPANYGGNRQPGALSLGQVQNRPHSQRSDNAGLRAPFFQSRAPFQPRTAQIQNQGYAQYPQPGMLDASLCAYCKKPGHWKQECFRLQRKIAEAQNTENAFAAGEVLHDEEGDVEPAEIAFMAIDETAVINSGRGVDRKVSTWIIDSGASSHMTSDFSLITDYTPFVKPRLILIGDDTALEATGSGTVCFTQGGMTVLYVPALGSKNLFSIASESKVGVTFHFDETGVDWTIEGKRIYRGTRRGNAYYFEFDLDSVENAYSATTLEDWHRRLGHLPKELIVKMVREKNVEGLNIGTRVADKCIDCQLNKCRRAGHPQRTTPKAERSGQSLHMDVIGPITPEGLAGQRFVLVIVDEFSKFRIVSCLKAKSQVPETVKIAINQTELQTGAAVLTVTSDNGTEFTSERLAMFLQHKGILHHLSAPYTPQQNGTAERENQTLINQARTLLNASSLPKQLWPESVMTATYISNRCISRNRNITPHEVWFGQKPNLRHLRTFGEQCSVIKHDPRKGKFDIKGTLMNFVGYTDNTNNYKCYDPISKQIIISCDVSFLNRLGPACGESQPQQCSETTVDLTCGQDSKNNEPVTVDFSTQSTSTDNSQQPKVPNQETSQISMMDDSSCDYSSANDHTFSGEQETAQQSSLDEESTLTEDTQTKAMNQTEVTLTKQGPSESAKNIANMLATDSSISREVKSPFIISRVQKATYNQLAQGRWNLNQANVAMESPAEPPMSFQEIEYRPDAKDWYTATDKEIDSMRQNTVYELVDRPTGTNIVGCRWVFTNKVMPDGQMKPKARLVAKGFSQRYGVDYYSTFAPVVNVESIRLLLAVAAQRKWSLTQCDIKTAFLYGHIDTEIFMEQPSGYIEDPNLVWRLNKSIYGLKQAPRCWCERLINHLISLGLTQSRSDNCILYRQEPLTIVAIYVDDLIVVTNTKQTAVNLIKMIAQEFEVNIMKTGKFLGLQYQVLPRGDIFIHQENYLTDILNRYNMWDVNPTDTPMDPGQMKGGPEEPLDESYPFREIIGALNYAATQCRPDIAFAVGWLGRKVTRPTRMDWNVLVRCMRYLKGTLDFGILYHGLDGSLVAYSDADYAGDVPSYRSTSGQLVTFNHRPIAWKSKLQALVVTSTTEAEYVAATSTIKTTLCIRNLCLELNLINDEPVSLRCDNKAAVLIATNQSNIQRTRHLGAQLAYTQQEQRNGTVDIQLIPGTEQLADILTKPLGKEKFRVNREKLLTSKSLILTLIQILILGTIISQAQVVKIDPVTWLKSQHYVENGKKLIRIRVNVKDRCQEFEDGLRSLSSNSTMIPIVRDALARCQKVREDKYLSILDQFEATRFPSSEEEVRRLLRPKRSTEELKPIDSLNTVPCNHFPLWLLPTCYNRTWFVSTAHNWLQSLLDRQKRSTGRDQPEDDQSLSPRSEYRQLVRTRRAPDQMEISVLQKMLLCNQFPFSFFKTCRNASTVGYMLGIVDRLAAEKSRYKRSTDLQEDLKKEGPVTPASYWLTALIPGYHSLYEYHNEGSAYNTVWKHSKRLLNHTNVLANHGDRLHRMESVHNVTIDSIRKISEGLGQASQKLEEMYTHFPRIWSAESQIYNSIQRDADLLEDIRESFKKEQFNAFAVRKLMNRGINIKRNSTDETSKSLDYIDNLAPESTQMADFYLEDDKMHFYVFAPIKDQNTSIYKAEVFKNWLDVNRYTIYTGPKFILVNNTNNCTRFIPEPTSLQVIEACTDDNRKIDIQPRMETVTITDSDRVEETVPKIIITKTHKLIQCYQNTMILNNHTVSCEKWPFAIPMNSSISIRGIFHAIDDSQILLEQEYKPRLNFNNATVVAPWVTQMNIIANNMNHASWQMDMIAQLRLQPAYDFMSKNMDSVISVPGGISLTIIIVMIIGIFWWCKSDPITQALRQQVLGNLSYRSKSEPVLVPQATAPSINISIGNSTQTLNYDNQDGHAKVTFDKLYPDLFRTNHSNRPATPYFKPAQPSITMPDETCSISSKQSTMSKKSIIEGIGKRTTILADKIQMCSTKIKDDVQSIKSNKSLKSVASQASKAGRVLLKRIGSIHSYFRGDENAPTRKLNKALQRAHGGLQGMAKQPDRFPKTSQMSTLSLPASNREM